MKPKSALKFERKNIRQLFFLYSCAVFYIVFLTPNRYQGDAYKANFLPFLHSIQRIHKPTGEHFWAYYVGYWGNVFGNIILFMPFGFFITWFFPDKAEKRIVFYGLSTSVCIELTQLCLKIGVCDIDDVLLNVGGTMAGIFLYKIMRRSKYM